jgi:hypothetical protein
MCVGLISLGVRSVYALVNQELSPARMLDFPSLGITTGRTFFDFPHARLSIGQGLEKRDTRVNLHANAL